MDAPAPSNGKHDVWAHRIVIGGLTVTVCSALLSTTFLTSAGHEVPPSIPLLGGTALGALTAMLAAIMRNGNGK